MKSQPLQKKSYSFGDFYTNACCDWGRDRDRDRIKKSCKLKKVYRVQGFGARPIPLPSKRVPLAAGGPVTKMPQRRRKRRSLKKLSAVERKGFGARQNFKI
jgi:hypothetical protein